ncbi:MAG: DUF1080 domain-containing protein [Fuerstiella sp.]|nr:DUF1080 domain-containing protein [Fuerstiella sp.]MCP4856133.1 DUF1080 domain-containing protein [Fuerstiella sp.]
MTFRTYCLNSAVVLSLIATTFAQEWKSGVDWQQPPIVTPGATNDQPPSDAIVLFGGQDLSAFENGDQWLIQDGIAVPRKTGIVSKQHFGDIQLHLEWSAPTDIRGTGQGRGNSGVYLMGRYEVQVLDSFENETYFDGQAGSIYKQTPPMANAMRKPGEWNTYDIFFTAPVFKVNGAVETPGYVTLIHNGVLALNHFELLGPSSYVDAPHYTPHAETGPISLQFHGDPVRFRNIWLRELKPAVGKRTSAGFNIVKESKKKPVIEKSADGKEADGKPADKAEQESKDQKAPTTTGE